MAIQYTFILGLACFSVCATRLAVDSEVPRTWLARYGCAVIVRLSISREAAQQCDEFDMQERQNWMACSETLKQLVVCLVIS